MNFSRFRASPKRVGMFTECIKKLKSTIIHDDNDADDDDTQLVRMLSSTVIRN